MTAEEIIKGMIEEANKDMISSKKKEIYEGIEKLLGQGFNSIVVATNNGNIVVGHKINVMSAIGATLADMYDKGQINKHDLELLIEGVIEVTREDQNKKDENDLDIITKKLEESLKKLFD